MMLDSMYKAFLYAGAASAVGSIGAVIVGLSLAYRRQRDELVNLDVKVAKLKADLVLARNRLKEQRDSSIKTLQDFDEQFNRRGMAKDFCRHIGFTREKDWQSIDKKILWDRVQARYYKLKEEFKEYGECLRLKDFQGCIDSLTDISYAAEVSYWVLGVNGNEAFRAVHESNMTKDYMLFRQDRKGKGPAFKEPNWSKVLGSESDKK